MIRALVCLLLGYLLGSLNPAALISKLKGKDLREHETGNLGASNTMLVFGKAMGALVLAFDMLKGFLAFKLALWIAPEIKWAAMAAGFSAVLGHCFPFYLKFKGGKGLAAFAGVVLAYHPWLFLFLLITGMSLMVLVNHNFILAYYAAAFFGVFVVVRETSLLLVIFAVACTAVILIKHFENLVKAVRKEDILIRDYIKTKFFHKSNAD